MSETITDISELVERFEREFEDFKKEGHSKGSLYQKFSLGYINYLIENNEIKNGNYYNEKQVEEIGNIHQDYFSLEALATFYRINLGIMPKDFLKLSRIWIDQNQKSAFQFDYTYEKKRKTGYLVKKEKHSELVRYVLENSEPVNKETDENVTKINDYFSTDEFSLFVKIGKVKEELKLHNKTGMDSKELLRIEDVRMLVEKHKGVFGKKFIESLRRSNEFGSADASGKYIRYSSLIMASLESLKKADN